MNNDQQLEAEIRAKASNAPRVTPAQIEAAIASEHYFTGRDGVMGELASDRVSPTQYELQNIPRELTLLTFCVLVLKNGFSVTGESACASPENFDADIGRKIARANAVQKIWTLEGYLLRQKLSQQDLVDVLLNPMLTDEGRDSIRVALESGDPAEIRTALSSRNFLSK